MYKIKKYCLKIINFKIFIQYIQEIIKIYNNNEVMKKNSEGKKILKFLFKKKSQKTQINFLKLAELCSKANIEHLLIIYQA